MSEVSDLILAIKRQLKAHGMTYKDVAAAMQLSEPSVKRLFSNERLTVERVAQLADLLGMTLSELMLSAHVSAPELHGLAPADELRLVRHPRLLLVAVCVLNHWQPAQIVAVYQIDSSECDDALSQLQGMGLLTVLPGQRIRLRIARDFVWLPDGPIRRFFREEGLPDFLDHPFTAADEGMDFVHGMLTDAARQELQTVIQRVRQRFATLHEASATAPLEEKTGMALLLARRTWEPPVFRALRR
ncbi:helix-turn-helix transcriptional regulator [Robbsia sp. KACC 23696]|uniref:helix-turn-helix domain-containing protein n=1 Tax=Robbsia sp. KACC 23696 TaxID=3149231 RepID=UPI00325AD524